MQGAHDVRFGASVAAGELQQWQSSKSVLVGIGQDFDRVVIRAPPHGFLGSRPSLSADAVQAVSDAVREHHGVWLETPHEGPIEAVIFDMRDEDGGQSLAALRVLAQEHGLVLETASSTYSRQFMWSRLASRLHAVGAHDGAPEEWWSTLRDVSAMEMASETLLATPSTWVPDFAELRLYAWFVKASVTNGGPPTLSGTTRFPLKASKADRDGPRNEKRWGCKFLGVDQTLSKKEMAIEMLKAVCKLRGVQSEYFKE